MAGSRTTKSLKNILFGLSGLAGSLIANFVSRSVFIRLLGAEYNGVNGLFTNILQVLNLAELGFATSIAYALYKPLKAKDERTTAALMSYFARIYRIIAIVVTVAGCCCIPFLQYLIAEDISELPFTVNELRGYFAMYLASTVCSYLLAYKRTIITADQNNYLVTSVDNLSNILLCVVQIVLLLIYKNFYAYLAIMIAKTIINNLVLHLIANKKYPFLRTYRKEKLVKVEKIAIFKNVQAAFLHRIGSVIIFSTTSIIISAFVSLIDAGKYSNYVMIVSGVNSFINILFSSVTASIGNLCVDESEDKQYFVFKKIQYIALFAAVFSYICYICLFNPFVELWVGSDMLMSMWIVFAISLNAMVGYLRKAVNAFKDAKGMFRNDWYKPLLEAGVGIGLAIGLSYVWGTFGVVLGYTLATMFIAMPVENFVLFKQGIHKSLTRQFATLIVTTVFAFAVGALGYYINTFIPSSIGWFILRFFFVVVFAAGAFILATCWTPEFKYYKNLAITIMKKLINMIKAKFMKKCCDAKAMDDNGSEESVCEDRNNEHEKDNETFDGTECQDNVAHDKCKKNVNDKEDDTY